MFLYYGSYLASALGFMFAIFHVFNRWMQPLDYSFYDMLNLYALFFLAV